MPNPSKNRQIDDDSRSKKITDPSDILIDLIDLIPSFVWTSGPNKECTYFNRAWLDYRGRTLEEELEDGFTHGIHPDDVELTIERYLTSFDSHQIYETEYRIRNADGDYRWVLDRAMPVYHPEDKSFLGYAGTCTDIDAKKRLEKELKISKSVLSEQYDSLRVIHRLSMLLHESPNVDQIVSETLNTLAVAHHDAKITTHLFQKGQLNCVASHGFDDDTAVMLQEAPMASDLIKIQEQQIKGVYLSRNLSRDRYVSAETKTVLNTLGFISAVGIPLLYQNKNLGWICLGFPRERIFKPFEIDALESISKTVSLALANARNRVELEFRANHDTLTGLANRAYLHRNFENFCRQDLSLKAALLLLDLDRFKEINDTLGHDIGDLVLQKMGPQLNDLLAAHETELIRLGGDEFAIVLYGNTDKKFICEFAELLLDKIRSPMRIDAMQLEIDASIGVAVYPDDGKTSRALLRSADVAMYESKRTGQSITFYDKSIDKHSLERLSLISELRGGIKNNQLELHYQPKLDLAKKRVDGFEALVRWQHQKMGLLYPDAFIPLAEVSDAIHYLTESVLEGALAQQAQWRDQGFDFSVAVNMSARNLVDNRCISILHELIEKFSSNPEKIELEITETALMQDPDGAVKILKQISELGIRLSIDDFGTGYSSLAYLRTLPIDNLKIDRTFVAKMIDSPQDIAIVRSTISLAHNLNLKVIAEGVEDEKTLDYLRDLGCDLAQGYFISKPVNNNILKDRFLRAKSQHKA